VTKNSETLKSKKLMMKKSKERQMQTSRDQDGRWV
jgi:hypothetical protein